MWLSHHLERATKRIFSSRGDLFFKIISEWELIVGSDLSSKVRPVDMNISNGPNRRAAMVLECSNPSFGIEVQMMAPIIIDKLTTYFGHRVASAIKIRRAVR